MQGLFGAFQSTINPGDEVLLSPYWTPIKDLIAHCEAKIVLVPPHEARQLGFEQTLSRYTTDRTKAIYYNTPQNPSGVVFTPDEAHVVARFARERDLIVIADEAYEDLVYDGEHFSLRPSTHVRTHDYSVHLFQVVCDDRLATRLRGRPEPWMTGLKRRRFTLRMVCQLQPNGLDLQRCNLIPQLSKQQERVSTSS